ncbi:hypothetical protein BGE01nite_09030 [Brevifollis gellanilyticus]|uniref:Uncharacterized protein n=2 Tax=Brevifollis gellanilyticus TaxID=748831 RepID=A0A512M4F6_9BACT|nr:hypothetical protein BGE01nite_09030 [Brevifollis gellanilyticus]
MTFQTGASYSQAPDAPEIRVSYNGLEIVNGDSTPNPYDNTEIFMTVNDLSWRVFTVHNTGTAPLTVGNVTLAGPDAGLFSISQQPVSPVPPNGSTSFEIRITPPGNGPYNASVNFSNDDSDENPYSFSIRGVVPPPAPQNLYLSGQHGFTEGNFPGTVVSEAYTLYSRELYTYTLVPGYQDTDNAAFVISGNRLCLKGVADYEQKNRYFVRIRASPTGQPENFLERSFEIPIEDVVDETAFQVAQQAYFKAHNTGAGDKLGYSVAVSGNTVVVGAPAEDSSSTGVNSTSDEAATDSGAAYVFVYDQGAWTQQAYLKAGNAGANDQFGYAVAISGDTLVVGAPFEDSASGTPDESAENAGAAYVFTRSAGAWSQAAYLKASHPGADDRFGSAVGAAGKTVVVGAWGEDGSATGVNGTPDNNATDAGAAYIFSRAEANGAWIQQAYLKAGNTGAGDQFGWSVAVSEDTVVIGAPKEDSSLTGVNAAFNENAANAGAAYVFTRSGGTWGQQAYLKAGNAGASDAFGWAVAASGDSLIVGAPNENTGNGVINGATNELAPSNGAAYVFVRNSAQWTQEAFLKTGYTGVNVQGGYSVGLSGDTAVMGIPRDSFEAKGVVVSGSYVTPGQTASGAARVFKRTNGTWGWQNYVKANNCHKDDRFGAAVAVSGDTVIMTAPEEDNSGTGMNTFPNLEAALSGAGYIYRVPHTTEIAVSGNGTYITNGDISPALADHTDYGAVPVAGAQSLHTFTVRNTGTAPLTLGEPILSGPQADDFSVSVPLPSSVPAADSVTFQVMFDPGATGLRSATLSLANGDANESPFVFNIQGSGTDHQIAVSGNSVNIARSDTTPSLNDHTDHGVVAVGMESRVRTFTVQCLGTTPLTLGSIVLSDNSAGAFSITAQPSASVAAGSSTTFQITFNPQSAGAHEATVSIGNDAGDHAPFTFSIRGHGIVTAQMAQTITFNLPAAIYANQGPVVLSAQASSGLPVIFSIASGPATIDGDMLTLNDVGTVKINATQPGDDNYKAAPVVSKTLRVELAPSTARLVDLLHVYDGEPHAARVLGGTGEIVLHYTVNKVATTTAPVNAGTYAVKAIVGGKTLTGSLVIAKVPLQVIPDSHRRFIGQDNPPLTVRYAGFVGEDTENSAFALPGAKRPVLSTSAKTASPGGVYPIKATGAALTNYLPVYVNGSLFVETFAGPYEALLESTNHLPGAKVEFAVAASSATLSGKLTVPGEPAPLSFTGTLTVDAENEKATGSIKPVVKGSNTYAVTFELPLKADFESELRINSTLTAQTAEGRRLWVPATSQQTLFAGEHTMILAPALPAGPDVPAGSGHATAKIDSKAVLKIAGKLADGTTLTASLLPDEHVGYRLFAQPYARAGSYLAGWLDFEEHPQLTNRVYVPASAGCDLCWAKDGRAADKSYRDDFGPVLTRVTVDPWIVPGKTATLASLLGLPGDGTFGVAHSGFASASLLNLPLEAKLNAANKVTITSPVTVPANLTKWTATITAATGVFSGSFELVDAGKKRTVPISGVLRQAHGTGGAIGAGHTLVPALPTASSNETISGAIQFTP